MLQRLAAISAEVGFALAPILGLLLVFQLVVLRRPIPRWPEVFSGLLFAAVGLVLLIYGLRFGILPLGEVIAASLLEARTVTLILAFGFLLGFTVTYSEPALVTMADQIDVLSSGAMSRRLFMVTVACGVAAGTLIGTTRILLEIHATSYFIPLLAVTLVLTYFAPERYTALAFDAAFATTGPLTVSLVIALGTGLATAMGRSDTLLYGFGMVTMAAIGPMVSVLLLGIILGMRGL